MSAVFDRPEFQDRVHKVVGSSRGTPDISMSASCDGVVVVYYSFNPARVGYHLVCGTSEASPEFAGIVAMADQLAGRRLGQLGGRLYELSKYAIVDVTQGNNTFGPFTNSDGNTYTVEGYSAGPGYDLASGRCSRIRYLSRSMNAAILRQVSPATINSQSSTSCAWRST